MEKLFDKNIQYTDPDTLQFCLPVSEHEFWYCEPDICNETWTDSLVYQKYLGYPQKLLEDSQKDNEVKAFLHNRLLWMSGEIDVRDFSEEEKRKLLADYGYKWDDFNNEAERNQIICENYFESNPLDFRNDI
ncbi:MAG: hypothetical protein LBT24_01390 [Tannerella sp.]|jgi:hypothetical protein|nr:hypothetical protein [Tannerella sp.]